MMAPDDNDQDQVVDSDDQSVPAESPDAGGVPHEKSASEPGTSSPASVTQGMPQSTATPAVDDVEPIEDDEQEEAQGVQSAVYSARQIARARSLLTALYSVRRTSRFYPMDHPATIDGAQELLDRITEYHDEGVDIEFAFFEGELLFGEKLLPEESVLFDQLIREFTSVGVGTLTISRGIRASADAAGWSRCSPPTPLRSERAGGVPRDGAEAGLVHAVIGDVRAFDRDRENESGEEPHEAYGGAIELLREVDMLVRRNRVRELRPT